jgi:Ras-related protein Rab-6A
MQTEDSSTLLRVVLIGDSSVGKTSLLSQLVDHKFNEGEQPTVGANYQLYSFNTGTTSVDMQIWDTAGQEKFRSLGPIYFRRAAGAIAVYDQTSKESFNHIGDWINSFTDVAGSETVICIAANKCDLAEKAEVPFSVAQQWAKAHNYTVIPTSALSGEGVRELFEEMARQLAKSKWIKKQNQVISRQLEEDELGKQQPSQGCVC